MNRLSNVMGREDRASPTFLILGAQKAGTTSLFRYLGQHRRIESPLKKEVHYFDDHFERGYEWYQSFFPTLAVLGEGGISGEASPYYLIHPQVPKRVRVALPDVKLICLLRDPVERAISHWNHEVRRGTENLPLAVALLSEENRIRSDWRSLTDGEGAVAGTHRKYSYVHRGRYLEQIERWHGEFPREQLLIIDSSRLFLEPLKVLGTVLDFLGIDDSFDDDLDISVSNPGMGLQATDEDIETLTRAFSKPNADLFAYLDRDFNWR